MVTVAQAFQDLKFTKKNINNLSATQKLSMANKVNSRVYKFIVGINPEDLILENTIFVQPDVNTYARPSDIQNHLPLCSGIFKTVGGSTYLSLEYDTETGTFTEGLTVTGSTSGATGVIEQLEDNGTTGFMKLSGMTDDFETDEIITDTNTGSATVESLKPYNESDQLFDLTHNGSLDSGYFSRGSNYIFTPMPTANAVFVDRYIPFVTSLASEDLSDNFVKVNVDDAQYIELLKDLLLMYYEIDDQNPMLEQNADIRVQPILTEFFSTSAKEPQYFIY